LRFLLRDARWVEQVVAAVNGLPAEIDFGDINGWKTRIHRANPDSRCVFVLEIQPRLETIPMWRVSVPIAEKERLTGFCVRPPNSPFGASMMVGVYDFEASSTLGILRTVGCDGSPLDYAHSLYLFLDALPTQVFFSRDARTFQEMDLSAVRAFVP
jgi:hypothetical protein